jgi:hypothetical protein
MELPDTTRGQSHIHAGDFTRNREIGLRNLSAPTAALNAPRSQIKRGPELRRAADISGGRVEECRHLAGQSWIVWTGDFERAWIGDVNSILRWEIGIAECPRLRDACRRASGRCRGRDHVPP